MKSRESKNLVWLGPEARVGPEDAYAARRPQSLTIEMKKGGREQQGGKKITTKQKKLKHPRQLQGIEN